MFTSLSSVYKGILLALAGYSAFSCADAGVKFLTAHYPIFQILVIENTSACLILLAFARVLGGTGGLLRKENFKIHGLRASLNFIVGALAVYAFRELPMTSAYPLFFTIPIFAALWALPLYKEGLPGNRMTAILTGFAGVVTATRPGTTGFDPDMLAPLCAAALIAVMFLSGKSLKMPTPFMLAFVPLAGTALMALPLAIPEFSMPSLFHLAVFALAGAFSAAGFTSISIAFRIADAAAVSPMMYIQMLWGIVLGFFIFGDAPDGWMLAGSAIIIGSGIYLLETERRGGHLQR